MMVNKKRSRHWPQRGLASIALLTALPAGAAPLPGGFEHSGWYQFEVVVMVDTQAETLESETWPMLPTVRYPAQWRWLRDPELQAALAAQHPDAQVAVSPSGHVSVRHPHHSPPDWTPIEGLVTEGDLAAIDELIELGKGTDTTGLRATDISLDDLSVADPTIDSRPMLPFEAIETEPETSPLIPLESLGIANEPSTDETPSVAVPFAAPELDVTLEPVTVTARGIPEPTPFVRVSLDQLEAGLARYQSTSEDQLVSAVSWLQGPDSDSRPILLDSYPAQDYPVVQGFIQLVPRGDTWRLGLNFWANTEGRYLPDVFDMPGPPPAPSRVSAIQSESSEFSPQPRADLIQSNKWLGNEETDGPMGLPPQVLTQPVWGSAPLTPIAPDAALNPLVREHPIVPERPVWPWRHMIHVADTIPLTENRLRYYDHPVIKVLAIWRELSWYELFRRGEAEREAAERAASADAITEVVAAH